MKKVLIIASLDQSANQERALTNQKILQKNYFTVSILDDKKLFSHFFNINFFIKTPIFFLEYLFQNLTFKLKLRPYPLWSEMKLRGQILKKIIKKNQPDILICQNPQDLKCLTHLNHKIFTIYDSPTIFFKEIKSENIYSHNDIKKIETTEKKVFKTANLVSFHWQTFFHLAKKNHLQITHPIIANWSCPETHRQLYVHPKEKIIHIGKLNSQWVNPSLLENLQNQSHLPIDIFSYEKPDHRYHHLKYSGYLKNINQLSQYKFGLITISDNELRNNGFSAKHLTYIAHGLPVLCPEWRQDKLLSSATIYYNETNFNQQVKKYSQPQAWLKKHQAALNLKKKLTAQNNLKQFINQLKHE